MGGSVLREEGGREYVQRCSMSDTPDMGFYSCIVVVIVIML